jgi:hypothetical protein
MALDSIRPLLRNMTKYFVIFYKKTKINIFNKKYSTTFPDCG